MLVSLLAVSAVSAADNVTNNIDNSVIQSSDDSIDEVVTSYEVNGQNSLTISYENQTLTAPFNDLQTMIDDASEGDEINLNNDYSLADGGNSITISKNMTINGNNHVLNGNDLKRILTIGADEKSIVLKNIKFEHGKESESESKGGAIFNSYSSTSITIINCEFKSNHASYGGAIDSAGTLTITNSTFENNNAIYAGNSFTGGAAIRARGNLTITGQNRFINNTCNSWGGAIYATQNVYINWDDEVNESSSNIYPKTLFENNIGTGGGAIRCENGGIYCKLTKFINNRATFNSGGAINVDKDSHFICSQFIDNHADNMLGNGADGGAIDCDKECRVDSCLFENNSATQKGGAINSENLIITATVNYPENRIGFINNKLNRNHGKGGAISVSKNVYINWNITNSYEITINGNGGHETNSGGGIYCQGNSYINNTSFIKNFATALGGAIYTSGESHIYNSKFEDNEMEEFALIKTGGYGGAIKSVKSLTVDSCIFNNNRAVDRGGAIHGKNIEITNSIFNDNTARDYGGAIYNSMSLKITNSIFNDNTAGDYGGAIFTEYTDNLIINNSTFTKNQVSAGVGGAIHIEQKCNLELNACRFEENTAGMRGGAICFDTSRTTLKISNSSFVNNYAKNSGGAIYKPGEITFIKNSQFTGNNAKEAGAIYTSAIIEQVSNSIFIKNKATTGDGGAIYINNDCDPEFISCRFEENTAHDEGGAIYTDSRKMHLKVSYSTFVNNKADNKGQSIYNCGYYDLLDMCWFGTNNPDFNDQFKLWYPWPASDTDYEVTNYLKISMKINDTETYVGNTYKATVYFYATNGNNLTHDLLHSTGSFYGDGQFSNEKKDINDMTADVIFTKETSTIYGKLDNQIVNLTVTLKEKQQSEVIITSCEDVEYPNALKVNYEISYMGDATYVIKNSAGEIKRQGNLTNPNNLIVENLDIGSYTITITNPETKAVLSSSATANFKVKRLVNAKVSADRVTYGNTTTITLTADHDGLYDVRCGNYIIEMEVINGTCTKHVMLNASEYETITTPTDELSKLNVTEAMFVVDKNIIHVKINVDSKIAYPNNITGTIITDVSGEYLLYFNEYIKNIRIDNGTYDFNFDDCEVGKYTIKVIKIDNPNYEAVHEATLVYVIKGNPKITLNIPNSHVSNNVTGYVYCSADGECIIKVENIEKTINITNNIGDVNLGTMDAGTYNATIEFKGDKNNNPASNKTTFTVSQTAPIFEMDVNGIDFKYGDTIEILHTLPSDATGHITYYIFDEEYANLSVNESLKISNLDAGSYLVEGIYSGDSKYPKSGDVVKITINKATNNVLVDVENTTYGMPATVKIKADADGEYTVNINGTVIIVNVANGMGSETVSLNAGTYTTKTTFNSKNYDSKITEATFEVEKTINHVKVDVNEAVYGESIAINILADVDGTYTININGTTTAINVKDGKGQKSINGLNAGTYKTITSFDETGCINNITESEFNVLKANPALKVVVQDCTYPNEVTGTISGEANGEYTITIGTYTTTVTINNNIATFNAGILDAGDYTTTITFKGNSNYNENTNTTTFTVKKAKTTFKLVSNYTSIVYGDTIEITPVFTDNVEGTIQYTLDDTTSLGTYSVDEAVILPKLNPGLHVIKANYNGDKNHETAISTLSLLVQKLNNNVEVTAEDVTYGTPTTIKIIADIDGTYTINLKGNEILVKVIDGKGNITISLDAGTYNTETAFDNEYYDSIVTECKFEVRKIDVDINVDIKDHDYGQEICGSIHASIDGEYTLTINESKTKVIVKNGTGEFKLGILDAGHYEANLSFEGNENYNAASNTTTFTVNKADAQLYLFVIDAFYPNNVTGVLQTNCNDTVKVTLNDTLIGSFQDKDQIIIFNLGQLKVGDYIIKAVFNGNKNYNAASNETTFKVSEGNSTFKIETSADSFAYNDTIVITHVLTEGATGTIKYFLNNGRFLGEKDVGESFTLPILDAGNYLVIANYTGDTNNPSTQSVLKIRINKTINNVIISADNVTYGNATTITVIADIDGTYTININENTVSVTVANGTGSSTISLNAGIYSTKTTFDSNNYELNVIEAEFEVEKVKSQVNITINNVTYMDNVKGVIYANVDGKYRVSAGGASIIVNVKDGIGRFNLGPLDADEYIATAELVDDKSYSSINTTHFTVEKANVTLTISIMDCIYTDDVIVTVQASADGLYDIIVGDVNKTINVVNSEATVNIGQLNAGEYEGFVILKDNKNFNENSNSANFTVDKAYPLFKINVNKAEYKYGEQITITHILPQDATGNITYYLIDGTELDQLTINETYTLPTYDVGNYTIIGLYNGDANYGIAGDYIEFSIIKSTNSAVVKVTDTKYRENTTITVSAEIDGEYLVNVNGTEYIINVTDGLGTKTITPDAAGTYYANLTFNNENYETLTTNTTFNVDKSDITLIVVAPDVTYPEEVMVFIHASEDGNYNLTIGDKSTTITVVNNMGEFNAGTLNPGEYIITATYPGDSNLNPAKSSMNVTVSKISTEIEASPLTTAWNANNYLIITLTDANGNPINGTEIIVDINGTKTYNTDKNGQVKVSTKGLAIKEYNAKITFNGDSIYDNSTKTVKVTVKKATAKIVAKTKVFKVTTKTKKYTITLKSGKNPIKNVKVTLKVKGKTYKAKTNKKGKATFKLTKLTKRGKYVAKIKFAGNKNYAKKTKSVKLFVKTPTKITAKKKTFKRTIKTKKYTVTLKTNKNKAMKKAKLTLKVKGKTYKAKTNKKGKATFKITKLTKKGKYTSIVKYAGNNYYKASSKKVKINIK